jgi:hypothetical protein
MHFERTTKKALTRDIYKVCDGEQTRVILGEYSPKSTWQPKNILKTVIEACLQKTSLEDICESKETPSADRVQDRLNELELDQIDQLLSGWMNEHVNRLQFHKNTSLTISIDLYQQPYYGDPSPDWIIGTKRKKGTSYCICFALVTITTNRIRCPIYVKLLRKKQYGDKIGLFTLIWSKLPINLAIKRVLLDRWFSYDPVIKFLEERGLEYVMATRRCLSVKKSLATIQESLSQLAEFAGINFKDKRELGIWCRKRGLDTFTVKHITIKKGGTPTTLVAAFVRIKTHNRDPAKRWTYALYLYITNCRVSPRHIIKLYSKRWIIETDIRCIGTFKAVTNSTSPQLRFLFFGLAVLFDLLWILYSTLINRSLDGSIEAFKNYFFISIKQSDTLQFTAQKFLRCVRDDIFPLLSFRGGDA